MRLGFVTETRRVHIKLGMLLPMAAAPAGGLSPDRPLAEEVRSTRKSLAPRYEALVGRTNWGSPTGLRRGFGNRGLGKP